jgi:hypothetical protein
MRIWVRSLRSRHAQGSAGVPFATRASRQPQRVREVVEENVMRAVNSHASTALERWTPVVESMGLTGRNVKRPPQPFSGS